MEGIKKKRKLGGIILLCMSFLLVIVLTFTLTLAWFFDSDWSSNYVTMAGSVGISIKDNTGKFTSGAGNLHFNISTDYAYPGQAIDASASVYNDGGISVENGTGTGSPCYVRARFIVYTNIGTPLENGDGTTNTEDQEASYVNSQILYQFLQGLVNVQNSLPYTEAPYYWQYYSMSGGVQLSTSGTSSSDTLYYLEGQSSTTRQTGDDEGYYYLCQKNDHGTSANPGTNSFLKALNLQEEAVFLWNDQFIIPWQLTNYSADKHIFVAMEFQAIQTFIPKIDGGVIDSNPDNQDYDNTRAEGSLTDPYYVFYNNISVQTVFNSCVFADVSTSITTTDKNGNPITIDFGSYSHTSKPSGGNGTLPPV